MEIHMLAHQRHDEILRQVNESGSVRVTDLVKQLGVSEMTVRRDIRVLAARGLLERVHGGAVK
ncbi:MAG: DeoR family transcriptional regulator, partial [Varibaculum cambriense]|nr:DeoR family transcriptional regulator [Varibaculum cambriense]